MLSFLESIASQDNKVQTSEFPLQVLDVNSLSVTMASTHGAVGAIVLLACNPSYREGLYDMFIQPFRYSKHLGIVFQQKI